MTSVFHIEAKWYLQVYTQIHGAARSAVAGKTEREEGEVSLTEWNSQVFCCNCVINIPMTYSAVSCECFQTPGCRCLPLISCHQGKLSTQRHVKVSSHLATRSTYQISWVYFCALEVEFHAPILSQLFSISFLCLKYMGQTWPSNRPSGSGTVYVLVLLKNDMSLARDFNIGDLQPSNELVTFSSVCTPHREGKCRNTCHRCQWEACRRRNGRFWLVGNWPVCQVRPAQEEGMEVEFLLVVVDEEALNDENVDPIALRVSLVSLGRQADTVGAGELDGVLLPALDSADHGLHVQGSDHWYMTGWEDTGATFTTHANRPTSMCIKTQPPC